MRRCAAALALSLVMAPAAIACPETSLGDLEDEVMCLECGTQLGIATGSRQAEQERAFISRMIDDCRSKDEIKTALAAEFGDEVLALPDEDGFSLAAYLIPAAILLGAGAAIAIGVRRWRGTRPPAATGAASSGNSKRLDDDLARYDL